MDGGGRGEGEDDEEGQRGRMKGGVEGRKERRGVGGGGEEGKER